MDPDCHRRDRADAIESGKCYEQSIRERQLAALSNIDGELCQLVAAELGLAVPAATEPPTERAPSPAVSQLGRSWPVAGRVIGIVAGAGRDPEQVLQARDAITAAGMLALIVAPVGGKLAGTDQPVQRTYATARSVEFDAVVLATSDDGGVGPDPRVVVLAEEAFRHAKAIGGWGGAGTVLEAAGVDAPAPGVCTDSRRKW
ncbi:hypothetical protein [Arthrobacter alpinus]